MLLSSLLSPYGTAAELQVSEILKRAAPSFHVQNRQADYTLRLFDAKGAPDGTRKVRVWIKKKADSEYRLLIRALEPAGFRGIALLSHYQESNVDQWIYIPAYRKSRRVIGSGGDASFLGSEFTLDDVSFARERDFHWERKPDAPCPSQAKLLQCLVIEGTRTIPSGEQGVARRVNWIDAETYKTVKSELYDRNGKLERLFTSEGKKLTMKNLATGRASQLEVEVAESKGEIPDSLFLPSALER